MSGVPYPRPLRHLHIRKENNPVDWPFKNQVLSVRHVSNGLAGNTVFVDTRSPLRNSLKRLHPGLARFYTDAKMKKKKKKKKKTKKKKKKPTKKKKPKKTPTTTKIKKKKKRQTKNNNNKKNNSKKTPKNQQQKKKKKKKTLNFRKHAKKVDSRQTKSLKAKMLIV